MAKIEKKTWPEDFQRIIAGDKTFDVRLNDFVCKPGDVLVLREYDPVSKDYTGRIIEKEVGYVAKLNEMPYWSKEDIEKIGFQVISLK